MRWRNRKMLANLSLPFLHLGGGNIDTISLTSTTHSKVDIEGRQFVAEVTLGDNVESGGVVEDMVVQREIAAKE